MPKKMDPDTSPGVKLLRLFRKLMLDGRRHFQTDLADELQCSPQTVIRLAREIESVVGTSLESGFANRRRWYRIRTIARSRLGLEYEELRYLGVCRDLAASSLPDPVKKRVGDTIFSLSLLMADRDFARREKAQAPQFAFFSKGRIDYTPHARTIETLVRAAEERRICLVRYRAGGKEKSREHRFAPGRIAAMNGALYILGAGVDEDWRAIRHLTNLAVQRIEDVVMTERRFDFELPEAAETFGLPWHEARTFRIRFTPGRASDYVRERIWAENQRLEELDNGGVLLEITTRSEPELLAWVRGFGDEATLL